MQLISQRIAFVPRYRQRIRQVPGRLANPVWVDDEALRHELPRAAQRPAAAGHRRAARGVRRPHPAAAARPHPPAVGGLPRRGPRARTASPSSPRPTRPRRRRQRGRHRATSSSTATPAAEGAGHRHVAARARARATSSCVTGALADAVRTPERGRRERPRRRRRRPRRSAKVRSPPPATSSRPWPARPPARRPTRRSTPSVGEARRYVMIGTDLEDYRKVRSPPGAGAPTPTRSTINDVILATIAGAFRSWLLTRGESVYPGTTIRAMVPGQRPRRATTRRPSAAG